MPVRFAALRNASRLGSVVPARFARCGVFIHKTAYRVRRSYAVTRVISAFFWLMARTKQTARWHQHKPGSEQIPSLPTAADRLLQEEQPDAVSMSPRDRNTGKRSAEGVATRSAAAIPGAAATRSRKVQERSAARGAAKGMAKGTATGMATGTRSATSRRATGATPPHARSTRKQSPPTTNTPSPGGSTKTNEGGKKNGASLEEAKETVPSFVTQINSNEEGSQKLASSVAAAKHNEEGNKTTASLGNNKEPSSDGEEDSLANESTKKMAASSVPDPVHNNTDMASTNNDTNMAAVHASDSTATTDNTTLPASSVPIVSVNGGEKYSDFDHKAQETFDYGKAITEKIGEHLDVAFRMAHRENLCMGSGACDDAKMLYYELKPLACRIGNAKRKFCKSGDSVSSERLGWIEIKTFLYPKVVACQGENMEIYMAALRGADEESDSTESFTLIEDVSRDKKACAYKIDFEENKEDDMEARVGERYAALMLHENYAPKLDLESYFIAWSDRTDFSNASNEVSQYWTNYGDSLFQVYSGDSSFENRLQWETVTVQKNRSLNLCFAKPARPPEEYEPDKDVYNKLKVMKSNNSFEDWIYIGNAQFDQKKVFSVCIANRTFLKGEVIGCVKPDPTKPSVKVDNHSPGERLKSEAPVMKETYFGRDKDLNWVRHYKPQFNVTSNVCMGLHRCMNVMGHCLPQHVKNHQKFARFIDKNANCELTESGLVIARKRFNRDTVLCCLYPTPGVPLSNYKFNKMMLEEFMEGMKGGWPRLKTENESSNKKTRNVRKRKSPPPPPTKSKASKKSKKN